MDNALNTLLTSWQGLQESPEITAMRQIQMLSNSPNRPDPRYAANATVDQLAGAGWDYTGGIITQQNIDARSSLQAHGITPGGTIIGNRFSEFSPDAILQKQIAAGPSYMSPVKSTLATATSTIDPNAQLLNTLAMPTKFPTVPDDTYWSGYTPGSSGPNQNAGGVF